MPKLKPFDEVLLDQKAEDHHRDRDHRADGGLRAVEAPLGRALELVEQHRQRRDLRMGQRQRQQELRPVEDEDEQECHHHAGCDERQDHAPDHRDAARAHQAGGVLERVGHLVDEGQHHPDDERQRRDRVDQDRARRRCRTG